VVLAATAAGSVGPHLGRWLAERRLLRSCAARRALVLTYDDGPGPRITPRILDLLARHDAPATFFPLGARAAQAAGVLDRAQREGHEIGCHGHAHVNALRAAPGAARRDIDSGYAALSSWTARDGVFRPPYGKRSLETWWSLQRRSAPTGWWTVDSRDSLFEAPDVDRVVREVVDAGGGVVLLHDFDRDAAHRHLEQYTLDVTAALLDAAATHGLRPSKLGDLL
jgi:peptidoglycan/xylan/chitin deacetylase (PgdA/CDA1 family)